MLNNVDFTEIKKICSRYLEKDQTLSSLGTEFNLQLPQINSIFYTCVSKKLFDIETCNQLVEKHLNEVMVLTLDSALVKSITNRYTDSLKDFNHIV